MSERSTSCSSRSSTKSERSCDREPNSPKNSNEYPNEIHYRGKVSSERLNSYRIAFYGSPAEKEAHRQQIRTKLKEQVQQKDDLHRKRLVDRVAESDDAVALDRKTNSEDRQNHQNKATYLKQFSNGNKKIMEEKERDFRKTRQVETDHERHLLNVNPINWNMTLH